MIKWVVLEEIVSSVVSDSLCQARTREEQIRFLEHIKEAETGLRNLYRGYNMNYALPHTGIAYLLKYHLSRADNIAMALRELHRMFQFNSHLKVLDVGSGTGCGVIAFWHWMHLRLEGKFIERNNRSILVETLEPAIPMRNVADKILPLMQTALAQEERLSSEEQKNIYLWKHCNESTLEEIAARLSDPVYDFILFSHTFDNLSPDQWKNHFNTLTLLTRQLKQGGILIFLTPNVKNKQDFIEGLIPCLQSMNMDHVNISIPKELIYPAEKKSRILISLREEINECCRQLGRLPIYGNDPYWDHPFYKFYGECDIFLKQ